MANNTAVRNRFTEFGQRERNQLAGALRTAIEVYTNDAEKLKATPGHEHMADDFKGYCEVCERLLEELENL